MKLLMNFVLIAGIASAGFSPLSSCAFGSKPKKDIPELRTVPFVDLNRYLGTWYEIASFPQSFQKDCVATQANYSVLDESTIRVINTCRKFTLDGELNEAHGKAKIKDKTTNAKLSVSFFWPFSGDYWVIDLGDEDSSQPYSYAVVGHPSRDYLWILSRTPQIDEGKLVQILDRIQAQYYDLSRLKRTLQPSN